MKDLVAPFLGVCGLSYVNMWVSRDLEESVSVPYVTVVNAQRSEDDVLGELQAVNLIRLRFSRDGLLPGLGAVLSLLLTMGDSLNLGLP